MADKQISELNPAERILPTDLFVLQQNNQALKLSGQMLTVWLLQQIDGHGGITSIQKTGTQGLNDTYTINYADLTTGSFTVTNGKGITSITKTSTQGLVDTYTITYNDGSTTTYTVTNGAKGNKGDKGDNAYIWIKYSSLEPNKNQDMHNYMDNWIGIYSGLLSTAPTDYTEYSWFEIKGDKGDGVSIDEIQIRYVASSSGTGDPPSESAGWQETPPYVAPANFLWTRTRITYSDGSISNAYSVARQGMDGSGSVSTVNGVPPDGNGDVPLITFAQDDSSMTVGNQEHHFKDSGAVRQVNSFTPVDGVVTLPMDSTATSQSNKFISSGAVFLERDFTISISATNATSYVVNDARISALHRVQQETMNISDNVSWVTEAGKATFTCSNGIPAMVVTFYVAQ